MDDFCPINPRGLQRQVQRLCDVSDLHRRTELPGDNVAREVVQYRAEVKPAPAGHLEIGEVGLPKLVRRCRLILELIGGLHDDRDCRESCVWGHSEAAGGGLWRSRRARWTSFCRG